jgi:hypothetical protein
MLEADTDQLSTAVSTTTLSEYPAAGADSERLAGYFRLRAELLGPSRTRVLTGPELVEVGRLVYADPRGFSLYGVPAPDMGPRGLRFLGRTAIECSVDAYSVLTVDALSATSFAPRPGQAAMVADLFCGSGNIGHHLSMRWGLPVYASELDSAVYAATAHNLSIMGLDIELRLEDYRDMLDRVRLRGPHDIYVVEPPWGPAFTERGLDLLTTSPPVPQILSDIAVSRDGMPCTIVIKTNDMIADDSLSRAFAGVDPLATITPPRMLPTGANMDFHIYRLTDHTTSRVGEEG